MPNGCGPTGPVQGLVHQLLHMIDGKMPELEVTSESNIVWTSVVLVLLRVSWFYILV